ncbi:hypothetical protein [Streptomyces sp. NPDC060002]|uniref:hypothetical protein n=1 Tax=Streptomyces sp. NPDC060002 TaxID=3347033 RepID=UPI0036AB86AF
MTIGSRPSSNATSAASAHGALGQAVVERGHGGRVGVSLAAGQMPLGALLRGEAMSPL